MSRHIDAAEARRMLRTRSQYRELGVSERELSAREGDGRLLRLRRSWVVDADAWSDLWPDGRHLLGVVAAAADLEGGAFAASHESAAALWQLPLFRLRPSRPHFTAVGSAKASSTAGVIRHTERIEVHDLAVIDGILCTSLDRTVFDLMRCASAETALAAADAALGRTAVTDRVQDGDLAAQWRSAMRARAASAVGARGVRQARWITEFSDGRAELPGESVTRLQLHRLGFARPQLQVPVRGPAGRDYWVDMGMDDADAWLEFDGEAKYLDEALRSGRTVEQVVIEEKRREDWIRGVTRRPLVRVGMRDIGHVDTFARRLAAFGIRRGG